MKSKEPYYILLHYYIPRCNRHKIELVPLFFFFKFMIMQAFLPHWVSSKFADVALYHFSRVQFLRYFKWNRRPPNLNCPKEKRVSAERKTCFFWSLSAVARNICWLASDRLADKVCVIGPTLFNSYGIWTALN